jgi:hypothetical protein
MVCSGAMTLFSWEIIINGNIEEVNIFPRMKTRMQAFGKLWVCRVLDPKDLNFRNTLANIFEPTCSCKYI